MSRDQAGHLDVGEHPTAPPGFVPVPFRQFVLKVHQRCNLACDYCYVYTMADQSWRDRPATMSPEVVAATARRIADHCRTHRLPGIEVVLHGGEPLLAGPIRLAAIVTAIREAVTAPTAVRFAMQTNATLLSVEALELLRVLDVRVGVSLDGAAADHDRRRRRPGGRGSHAGVRGGLSRLTSPPYTPLFAGLLCTIDLRADPIATYTALTRWSPPVIDFLLPHANWATLDAAEAIRYGRWLAAVFDHWHDGPSTAPRVRLFDEIVQLAIGGAGRSDQVGLSPSAVVVVETDGDIEQADSLKSAYPGAAGTGFHVRRDAFDDVLAHPGIVARQIGLAALGAVCLGCDERSVCGGGHYAHRYRPGAGFRNPSVYCDGLLHLIAHIRRRIDDDVKAVAA